MEQELLARITSAVEQWAQKSYKSDHVVIGLAAEDESEDEDADRYLVDFAVREVGYWLLAEVWVAGSKILSINDLGEGLPLDNAEWPWSAEITR